MIKESIFQMTKPILKKFNFTLKDGLDIKKHQKYEIDLQTKNDYNKNMSENSAMVHLQITIDHKDYPFAIEMLVETKVIWKSVVDDDTVLKTLKTTIPAHLLSYLRPIISVVTSYTPYHLNIPLLDLSE